MNRDITESAVRIVFDRHMLGPSFPFIPTGGDSQWRAAPAGVFGESVFFFEGLGDVVPNGEPPRIRVDGLEGKGTGRRLESRGLWRRPYLALISRRELPLLSGGGAGPTIEAAVLSFDHPRFLEAGVNACRNAKALRTFVPSLPGIIRDKKECNPVHIERTCILKVAIGF